MEQQMKVLIVVEPTFIVITFAIIGIVDFDQIAIAVQIAIAAAVVQIIIIVVNNIGFTGFVDFNH
jgi:hypothetical protein